jgi:hypothetical protein
MVRFVSVFSAALLTVAGTSGAVIADSIETQGNPISDGAITIEAGNPDRSDWSLIPWYEEDSDDNDLGVDPYRVQIAHDSTDVYFHIQLNQFDIGPDEQWRIQLWVDSDQDWETGYQANWAIGPESLLEISTIYDYTGVEPGEWAWNARASDLPRDQTDPLDVAVQFPRQSIGSPQAFDFLVMGQNFPDGNPEDTLPDFADQEFGDFFTYELTGAGSQLQAGDANQDLQFNQLDLVKVQIAAKYLTGQAATWGEGDWNGAPGGSVGNAPAGDRRFDQLDIIAALAPGHYLTGPYAAVLPDGQGGGTARHRWSTSLSRPPSSSLRWGYCFPCG